MLNEFHRLTAGWELKKPLMNRDLIAEIWYLSYAGRKATNYLHNTLLFHVLKL